jgi:hypothetical protein
VSRIIDIQFDTQTGFVTSEINVCRRLTYTFVEPTGLEPATPGLQILWKLSAASGPGARIGLSWGFGLPSRQP